MISWFLENTKKGRKIKYLKLDTKKTVSLNQRNMYLF